MKVDPVAWRIEGPLSMKRPVFDPIDFAEAVERLSGVPVMMPEVLDWNNLWPRWAEWLKA
jgi:hypothetical protein